MRVIALALSLAMLPCVALSAPVVGDAVTYDAFWNNKVSGTVRKEVVKIEGDRYLERETTVTEGVPPKVKETWKLLAQAMDKERAAKFVESCASDDLEILQIGSRELRTCKVETEKEAGKSIVWVADVPFGAARIVFVGNAGATARMTIAENK
jgi:hypothetical protein